jgi:cytochrome c-type biogenesis protein CcmE
LTELDLTPREPLEDPSDSRRRRSFRNVAIMGTLGLVLSFVLYQAVTSARVFFYNVDEAVELRAELGDQNIRMQGTVIAENGVDDVGALLFDVAFEDETAVVRHSGDEPSNLFAIGEKVVVEGHWQGDVFQSHQVLVKHSEEYVEDNPERLTYELELEPEPAPSDG